MKVVQLINGLGRGGGERMLLDLVRAGGARWSVYTLTRGGPIATELRAQGVSVRQLRRFGLPLPWRWVTLLVELGRADVLHTHFFWSDVVGALFARLRPGIRLVSTRHETGWWMQPHHRWLERRIVGAFDAILCVSEAVRAALLERGADPARLTVVPPGIAPPAHSALNRIGRRIVSIGRLEPVKGHGLLVDAFALVAARHPDLELWIIGDGSERLALQSRAHGLRIRFTGELPHEQAQRELRGAACFVLPSESEGLPLSLLEAMAAGVPVVATDAGGTSEVIENGVTGIIVGDRSPEQLARAIEQVLAAPDEARRRAEAGRAAVLSRFGATAFVDRVFAAYRPADDEPRRSGGDAGRRARRSGLRRAVDVCMLVRSGLRHDSRVQRQASALASAGREVLVLAEGDGDGGEQDGYRFVHLGSQLPRPLAGLGGRAASLLRTLRWNAAAVGRLLREAPTVVHCHDLDTLAAGAFAAAWIGSRLVYDSHELWTERHRTPGRGRRVVERLKYGALERLLIHTADAVLTVSEGVAAELTRRYGVEPVVVRNVPDGAPPGASPLRARLGREGKIVLHLGVVEPDRGLEQALRALTQVNGATLVLLGPARPGALDSLQALARQFGVADRFVHLPPVAPRDVVTWASGADVGLCTFLPTSGSFRLALPNKLFEYAFAGVPVVASDLPEMRRWIERYRLGVVCDPFDPSAVARCIRAVLAHEIPIATEVERTAFREAHGWGKEQAALGRAYPGLELGARSAQP